MPSPAVHDAIRRFADSIDAVLLVVDVQPGAPADAIAAAEIAFKGNWFATAFLPLSNIFSDSLNPHDPDATWAAPLVKHDLVPRASRLLRHVLDRYSAIQAAGGVEFLGPDARRGLIQGDPLWHVLHFAVMLAHVLGLASTTLNAAGLNDMAYDAHPAAVRKLVDQLGALSTVQALADAARLVTNDALPAVVEERAASGSTASASAPPAAAPPQARSGSSRRTRQAAAGAGAAAAASSAARAYGMFYSGCDLVGAVARCLGRSFVPTNVSRAAGPGSAAMVVAQRRLLGYKVSGALTAMCAATLAASALSEGVPANLSSLSQASRRLYDAQLYCSHNVGKVAQYVLCFKQLVLQLVLQPDVERLSWVGLEQLSALATEEASGSAAPAAPYPRWLLLNRQVVHHVEGEAHQKITGEIWCSVVESVAAALEEPIFRAAPPSADATAAPGDAPSRRRFAALAAPVARALCAEAEAMVPLSELRPRAYTGLLSRLIFAMYSLCSCVMFATHNAPEDEMLAALPYVLETVGWALSAMASPWAAPAGFTDTELAVTMANELGHRTKRWEKMPPATQAACARRLLPTGLLRTLDYMLRQELARTNCAIDGIMVNACGWAMPALLVPVMRARLESCRAGVPLPLRSKAQRRSTATGASAAASGGDEAGGPLWHPQDELGLVVTWAKLGRREAAAAALRLLGGPAAAPPGTQHLMCMGMLGGLMGCVLSGRVSPSLDTIVEDLPPPPPPADGAAAGAAGPQPPLPSPAAQSAERVRVAVLEAITLCTVTSLQLLEAYCDSLAMYVASAEFANAPPSATERLIVLLKNVPMMALPTIKVISPGVLLAAEPQRKLAALGRLMAAVQAAVMPPPGMRGAAAGLTPELRQAVREVAMTTMNMIASMVCDEHLAGAAAGWLAGGSEMDVQALEVAVRAWVPDGAADLARMHRAAASSDHAGLLFAGRFAISEADEAAYHAKGPVRVALAAGGPDGAPLWPPRVLRLCGNPSCCNMGDGEVEAELRLQQCGGCRVLRYCCGECQREHWRQGHKAECAAVAAGRPVGSLAVPATAAVAGGGEAAAKSWSLEELMAMRPRELKALLAERGVDCSDCVEKADLVRRVLGR